MIDKQIAELEKVQRINESTIEYVCNFVTMPAKMWRDSNIDSRLLFQEMMFPSGVSYNIKTGKFGTEGLSPLFSVMSTQKASEDASNSSMVIPSGIEPLLSG